MNMQKILGYMRKAIEKYNMIEDGDKIIVGLSGGKDSITLAMGLKALQRFYPKKFEILCVSVNPGFEFFDSEFLKATCEKIEIPFIEEKTHIKGNYTVKTLLVCKPRRTACSAVLLNVIK